MAQTQPTKLPLTVRESGETRLNAMQVDPGFARALQNLEPINKANMMANKELGIHLPPRLSFTFKKGDTLTKRLSPVLFGNQKSYADLNAQQRYFILTLAAILKQNDINADVMSVGTKIVFDFAKGEFYVDKPEEAKPLQLQEFVEVKEKSTEQREALMAKILRAGGLYDAMDRGGDKGSYDGRVAFMKAHKDEFISIFNGAVKTDADKLDPDKENFGYRRTNNEAQNYAFLETYIALKTQEFFGTRPAAAPAAAPEPVAEPVQEPVVQPEPAPATEPVPAAVEPAEASDAEPGPEPEASVSEDLAAQGLEDSISTALGKNSEILKQEINTTGVTYGLKAKPAHVEFSKVDNQATLSVKFTAEGKPSKTVTLSADITEEAINASKKYFSEMAGTDVFTEAAQQSLIHFTATSEFLNSWEAAAVEQLAAEPEATVEATQDEAEPADEGLSATRGITVEGSRQEEPAAAPEPISEDVSTNVEALYNQKFEALSTEFAGEIKATENMIESDARVTHRFLANDYSKAIVDVEFTPREGTEGSSVKTVKVNVPLNEEMIRSRGVELFGEEEVDMKKLSRLVALEKWIDAWDAAATEQLAAQKVAAPAPEPEPAAAQNASETAELQARLSELKNTIKTRLGPEAINSMGFPKYEYSNYTYSQDPELQNSWEFKIIFKEKDKEGGIEEAISFSVNLEAEEADIFKLTIAVHEKFVEDLEGFIAENIARNEARAARDEAANAKYAALSQERTGLVDRIQNELLPAIANTYGDNFVPGGLKYDTNPDDQSSWSSELYIGNNDTNDAFPIKLTIDGTEFEGYDGLEKSVAMFRKLIKELEHFLADRLQQQVEPEAASAPSPSAPEPVAPAEAQPVSSDAETRARASQFLDELEVDVAVDSKSAELLGEEYKREVDEYLASGDVASAYTRIGKVILSDGTELSRADREELGAIRRRIEENYGGMTITNRAHRRDRSLEKVGGATDPHELAAVETAAKAMKAGKETCSFSGFLPQGQYLVNGQTMTVKGGTLEHYDSFTPRE